MNRLKEYREEYGVLIAAHRGTSGGNILQNTSKAYLNSIRHKADMFEVDVIRSKDGDYFAFHNGQESLVFHEDIDIRDLTSSEIQQLTCYNSLNEPIDQKIEQVRDILSHFEGKSFINIDRSWFYWDTFLEELKGYPALEQMLLKSPAEVDLLKQLRDSGLNIMYMPIVKTKEELELILNFEGVNTVAVELLFDDLDADLIKEETIQSIHDRGWLIWVNSLRLNDTTLLSAGLDDDAAIEDGGHTWGKLLALGFDIIQTDWPYLLYSYLVYNDYK